MLATKETEGSSISARRFEMERNLSRYSIVLLIALFHSVKSGGVSSVTGWVTLLFICTLKNSEIGTSNHKWNLLIALSECCIWCGNVAASSQPFSAWTNSVRESFLWGVSMTVLAAISFAFVVHHCHSYREALMEIRLADAFDELINSQPPFETERNKERNALQEQIENLWKAAFVIFVAASTRMARSRRKGRLSTWDDLTSDRLAVFLLALFAFLLGSWAFHSIGLYLAKDDDPFKTVGMEPTHDIKEIRRAYWKWYKSVRLSGE